MKNSKHFNFNVTALLGFILVFGTSCERELSKDVKLATFPATAEVFIDSFSGGLEYLPFAGSKFDAFTVDDQEFFAGTASMRFDIPNVGDPSGAFAGAIFPDNGGRDLTGFDALTFWAKSSKAASINEIGFGNDFGENKFLTTLFNLDVGTAWKKYIIPIPDPSKLTFETGVFWYSEGPEDGSGYTFWIDELKFEKLGTIAHPRPAILGGQDRNEQNFEGAAITLSGLTQTFNLADGSNQTVGAAPSYYTFSSSDETIATVDELGVVSLISTGTTEITALLGSVEAAGSLTVESLGSFTSAPIPTEDPANVLSVFSDTYTDIPVDFYNGFFAPFQTTLGGATMIGSDNIISYTELNFVATEFKNPTLNASSMTHFHADIQIQESIDPGDFITIELGDFGSDGSFGGGDDSSGRVTIASANLTEGQWISLDIPLNDFTALTSTSNLAQIFFISDATISSILVDNMYFYQ